MIGSLTAYSTREGEPSAWASDWLQALANQAALAITHDRLTEEIREARRTAELAGQAKNEFLSRMSHELRTPLNGILGYAQILKRTSDLTPAQQNGLNIIQQSDEHLLTLINDILDLSKIETHKLDLQITTFNLNDFLQDVAGMADPHAQKKGLNFTLEVRQPLPESVCADAKRLRQVLLNLLNNAARFTEQGAVTLRVQEILTPRTAESVEVLRFAVTDTGAGIAPERLERIFMPFEQTPNNKLPSEGAGLGLAISRHIVQMLESKLQVESEVNCGSTFWFDVALPVETECTPTLEAKDNREMIGDTGVALETPATIELAPPQADLAALYAIAKLGNMRKINDWAKKLMERDAGYRPFAEKVQELARGFHKKQIVALAERYLEV